MTRKDEHIKILELKPQGRLAEDLFEFENWQTIENIEFLLIKHENIHLAYISSVSSVSTHSRALRLNT